MPQALVVEQHRDGPPSALGERLGAGDLVAHAIGALGDRVDDAQRAERWLDDGAERRVRITGGKLFPESTDAQVVGAFDDESVKGGWIVEGYQLELSTPSGPVLTSVVESVNVAS